MRWFRAPLLAVLALSPALLAGTHTWTGASGPLWSDPGNWTGGSPAGDPNATLVFPAGAANLTSTDDIPGVSYVAQIDVASGYTLSAAAGSSLALAGSIRWTALGGTSTIAIPIALYGGTTHSFYAPSGLGAPSGTLVLSEPLSGSPPDGLEISGWNPFAVVLTGASPFSGPVSITYATLEVDGSLASTSVIAGLSSTLRGSGSISGSVSVSGIRVRPGTEALTGILSVGGDLSMSNGILTVRLNGTTPGVGHDQLQVTGSSTLQPGGGGASLGLDVSAGFLPPIGTVFTILQGTGPLSGSGFQPTSITTSSCMTLQVGYTATSVTLTRVAGGPPLGTVTISSTGGQTTYCNGTAGTATVTDAGGCGNTHQWGYRSVSGGPVTDIAGETGATYLIDGADFPGAGTYYLVETTTPTDAAPMTSNELTITVLPPTAGTASGTTTLCAGQSAQLHATGGSACSWSPVAGLSDPASCDPVATPSATTTYTVSFSGSCAATNQPSVTVSVLPLPATKLTTVAPCRALDTRGGARLAPGETRSVPLTGVCGIPATARALAANVTAVTPDAAGDLRVYPANVVRPLTSVLGFWYGVVRANNLLVQLPCDDSGLVNVFNESVGATDVLLDLVGYFE